MEIDEPNDGRYPDGSAVRTPYPTREMTASTPDVDWPWMTAEVEGQCAPNEWLITITDARVAQLEDGTPAGPAEIDIWWPQAFRKESQIRREAEFGHEPEAGL
ncbi:MAG TPA: hypothetical protein VGG75_14880 [Trebonia sp.]|jgi:hypothetical protein